MFPRNFPLSLLQISAYLVKAITDLYLSGDSGRASALVVTARYCNILQSTFPETTFFKQPRI
jgi:hypothetical protein